MEWIVIICLIIGFAGKWLVYQRVLPHLESRDKKWIVASILLLILSVMAMILINGGPLSNNIWINYGILVVISYVVDFFTTIYFSKNLSVTQQIYWAALLSQVYPLIDLAQVMSLSYYYRMQ